MLRVLDISFSRETNLADQKMTDEVRAVGSEGPNPVRPWVLFSVVGKFVVELSTARLGTRSQANTMDK